MSSHERQVVRLAFLSPLPGLVVALWLLWSGEYQASVRWTLTVVLLVCWVVLVLCRLSRRVAKSPKSEQIWPRQRGFLNVSVHLDG